MPSTRNTRQFDFSGGIQNSTSRQLRKSNELVSAKNTVFGAFIGAVARRNGYVQFGSTVQSGKDGLGAFIHRYSTGTRAYVAVNNSGDTDTSVRYYAGPGWTELFTTGTAGTRLNAISFLDEAYVFGASGSTFMTPVNVDSSPAYSTTRNLYTAPKAKFIAEFNGALYAMNVDIGGTKYPDRVYKSSVAEGVITFIKKDQTGVPVTGTTTLNVDSARYLKVGMALDIYRAGTETKLWDVTITAVDKIANSFSFTSTALTFATTDVTTATDVITLSSTTNFPTGRPVIITSTTTVPAGLVSGTVYYVINVTGTTIKLATTLANANSSTAIDITSQGTGTHTISTAYAVSDNDELWGDGRKGKLSVYWNVDYPNPEDSDYLRVPPGQDEDNSITGYARTNNRLFIYTKDSMLKYDGQNLIPVSTTIGCLQHECIRVIGAWIIWPHTSGIWAYNDTTGALKLLSRGIRNIWTNIPLANFAKASAVADNNIYKLAVGAVPSIDNVTQVGNLRLIYDFDMNIFSTEWHTRNQRFHVIWTQSNVRNSYFLDDTGKFWKDDTGYLDDTATIPYEWEIGPNNFGVDEEKDYQTVYVYCKQPRDVQVYCSIDGGAPLFLGQCKNYVERFVFPRSTRGRDINYKFVHNAQGEGPVVEGVSTNYNFTEATYATR